MNSLFSWNEPQIYPNYLQNVHKDRRTFVYWRNFLYLESSALYITVLVFGSAWESLRIFIQFSCKMRKTWSWFNPLNYWQLILFQQLSGYNAARGTVFPALYKFDIKCVLARLTVSLEAIELEKLPVCFTHFYMHFTSYECLCAFMNYQLARNCLNMLDQ